MQQNYQYNFGFSREIGFDTAIEVRYVGGRSDNMVRGFDFNQVNINAGGFLDEFLTARNNCRIALAQTNEFLDSRRCTTSEMSGATNLPGQMPLGSYLPPILGVGFIRDYVQRGIVGELALI